MKRRFDYHYCWAILACCCVMMSVGFGMCLNSVGVFLPAVAKTLGVSSGKVSYYMTIQGLSMILGMRLAGKLLPKKDIRHLVAMAAAIIGLCFFLMSFGTRLLHWYILAVPMGIAIAFIAPLPISLLISNWFDKRSGFASGVAFAFSGITGSILSPIASRIITTMGWQAAYRVYALIALAIMVPVALLFLVFSPEEKELTPYGAAEVAHPGLTMEQAKKMPIFYTAVLLAGFLTIGGGFNQQFPSHAAQLGMSAAAGSLLVSVCMIMQLVANVPLGILCDTLGVQMSSTIYCGIGAAGALILTVSGSSAAMYLGCALYGVAICQTMVVSPLVAERIFGKKDFARINSVVMGAFALAGALCHTVYAGAAELSGSYTASLMLACMFYLTALVLVNFTCSQARPLIDRNWELEQGRFEQ